MLRKIYLHGPLAEKYGPEFRLSVSTAGEAIRALHVNFPGFTDDLREGQYELVRGANDETGFRLGLEEVNDFALGSADFHIVPVIEGSSKGGGAIKTILGVALVGTALAFSGGMLAAPLAASGIMSGITYGNLAIVGLALAISGVATLLTPKKKVTSDDSSFSIKGPSNTYAQGNPVPLVYGRLITGSVLVSAGMDVEPIPVGWDPTNGNTVTGTYNLETGNPNDPVVYTGVMTKITFDDGTSTYGGGR